jgi:2-polyprenyl-3-methyl-5-hydroxy-6-metoxy-1,4-benzoquinol methylase
MECRICGNSKENNNFVFNELMYGTLEEFEYFECSACGCLQISKIPEDLSKFYPSDYYSFNSAKTSNSLLKNYMKRKRFWYAVNKKGIVGKILTDKFGIPPIAEWIKVAGVNIHQRILDVGCGDGHIIRDIYNAGFKNVKGIDAFIEKDFLLDGVIKIEKRTIAGLKEKYDLIMFNHSFEHVLDPISAFSEAAKALNKKGVILIRIPVFGKYAWRKFGKNWVGLDAPRHLFLHSEKSIKLVGRSSGFELVDTVYDSNSFQFWGSLQYQKNIKLWEEKSYAQNPASSIFSKEEIVGFEQLTTDLNEKKDGDQACFYFRKE